MNKVITINLHNKDYKVEEGGFTLLQKYLEQAEKRLKHNPDKKEILHDFEQAIADKCEQTLSTSKTVITTTEVEKIIADMGPVEAAEKDSDEESSDEEPLRKKLYIIKDGAWISGVCNGLAIYFGVDVTLIRLLFVFLTFVTHGAWIFLYIVMMFVIPWATTPDQKAHARGERFTADKFFTKASKKYEKFHKEHILPSSITQEQFVENWGIISRIANRIAAVIIGLIAGLVIWGFVVSVWSILTTNTVLGYSLGNNASQWVQLVYMASIFFLLFWPLRLGVRSALHNAGVNRQKNAQVMDYVGWTGWAVALIFFVTVSIQHSAALTKNIQHFQEVLQQGETDPSWHPYHYDTRIN